MKVKRNSWHYRLNDFLWNDLRWRGKNLCRYFWMTVWSVFVVMGILLSFGSICWALYTGLNAYEAIVCLIIVVWAGSMSLPFLAVAKFRHYVGENIELKTPNILIEFIKAKKGKYCPMIDFE